MAGARAWYEKAQASAREIGNANNRENNLQTLTRRLAALDSPAK
jgi:hypothetical protein